MTKIIKKFNDFIEEAKRDEKIEEAKRDEKIVFDNCLLKIKVNICDESTAQAMVEADGVHSMGVLCAFLKEKRELTDYVVNTIESIFENSPLKDPEPKLVV